MQPICLVLPLLAGKEPAARAFMNELDRDRMASYRASQERIGIHKELWFLAEAGEHPTLIAYLDAEDFGRAVAAFAASQDGFDLWFKACLADCTGLDLNNPPPLTLPKLLSQYSR